MARQTVMLSKNLAVGQTQTLDTVLPAGDYIFSRGTTLGVVETFAGTAVLDPGGASEELLMSADVPFDYGFQRARTLAAPKTLRLTLTSLDLAETRWSSVVVEFDALNTG